MTDNAGLKGAAQIAAEQVASTKNVRIKPDIVDPLEVCQAERDQARRSAKFWNENSADLSAQIAERTDALIAAKAEIERLRKEADEAHAINSALNGIIRRLKEKARD